MLFFHMLLILSNDIVIIYWLFYAPLKTTCVISIKDTSFQRELNKVHLVFKHLNFRCIRFSLKLVDTLLLNGFDFIIIFFVSVLFIQLLSSSGNYTPNL